MLPPLTPGVKRLLIVLAVVFAAQLVGAAVTGFDAFAYRVMVVDWFGLNAAQMLAGRIWQPLTYMLLHSIDGWGHLLSNAIGLYFIGSAVEERVGRKSLYRIAFASGLVGAFAVLVVQGIGLATGRWTPVPVVGASGAISGLVGVFCVLFWDRWLYLFFIRLRGRHVLLLFLVVDAVRGLQGVLGTADVAVHCHLGGLAYGLLWINGWGSPRRAWLSLRHWWVKRKLKVITSRDPDEQPPTLN